ncbi:hypothetical protein EDB19DRAFT_2010606 [Suillus lakei]|nr:hypothetical protein EDB19DRAFT_2010606 [Suillus lakei]
MEFQQVITSDHDPIEVTTPPHLKSTRPLSLAAHSTPKSGLAKRMKNRHGELPSPSQLPVRADEPKALTNHRFVAVRKQHEQTSFASLRNQSKGAANLNGHGATPSHSQPLQKPPASLAKWSALREPSPSTLANELDLSCSPIGQGGILGELAGKASDQNSAGEHSDDDSAGKVSESLFTLPASEVPFPYSQYNASVQKRIEVVPDSEPESEAEAGGERKKTTNTKMRRSRPPYRRLTDIASQGALFSQSTPVAPGPTTMANGKRGQADGDDDDSSSSSESDDEDRSHIPQAKRAGKLRSKKTKGLLSLNY